MKWVRYFLICCLSLFVISCDKEVAVQPREEVSLKRDKSYEYEKIQKPELAFSKDMKQMYLIVNEEVPYYIFRMRTSGKDSYMECQWEGGDKKWMTKKTAWNDFIAKNCGNGEIQIAADTKQNLYVMYSDNSKTKCQLYKIKKNREIRELHIPDITSRVKGQKIVSFSVINESRLVFFFSLEEDATDGQAIEYDSVEEKFLAKDGKIDDISAGFDTEGNYYVVAPRQQLILKKSLYESVPKKVIKCEGMTSESSTSGLVIDDDFGYLLTGNGIYGGKLDANEWEKKIDGKELYYCKDFPSPVLGIANMVKVPGRDLEFYLMTWKNAECSDFEWVHYFAGKKP